MSSEFERQHPQQIYAPGWHGEHRTPVVDGKYHDVQTGEVVAATGHEEYLGPPAVDILIRSQHEDTEDCMYRTAQAFPMELLLCQIMKVVADRKLKLDSVTATAYTIRVLLEHELTKDEFYEITSEMAHGVWNQDQMKN